jgi:hypothetical protein
VNFQAVTPEQVSPIEHVLHDLGNGPVLIRMDLGKPHSGFLDSTHSIGDHFGSLLSDSFSALFYFDVSPEAHPVDHPPRP